MKSLKSIIMPLAGLLALSAGSSFAIPVWSEVGNAGRTIATAQDTGSGALTSIVGSFSPYDDVDFYNIALVGGAFSAAVPYTGADPMLFLWDSAGNPLLFNDDWNFLDAYISGNFAAGDYILGISTFSNGYGLHFADTGFGGSEGIGGSNYTYDITLTGVQGSGGSSVPDGGWTLALLGFAMSGMAVVRRKLKRA